MTMSITREQEARLKEIGEKHNLRFIVLHGSYAKGTAREGSDMDIAALGRRPLPFREMIELHGELSDILGDTSERELDLKSLHGVDHLFRYHVVRGGMLLYGARADFEEFKAYAYRDYIDSRDLRELECKLLMKSIGHFTKRYAHAG